MVTQARRQGSADDPLIAPMRLGGGRHDGGGHGRRGKSFNNPMVEVAVSDENDTDGGDGGAGASRAKLSEETLWPESLASADRSVRTCDRCGSNRQARLNG